MVVWSDRLSLKDVRAPVLPSPLPPQQLWRGPMGQRDGSNTGLVGTINSGVSISWSTPDCKVWRQTYIYTHTFQSLLSVSAFPLKCGRASGQRASWQLRQGVRRPAIDRHNGWGEPRWQQAIGISRLAGLNEPFDPVGGKQTKKINDKGYDCALIPMMGSMQNGSDWTNPPSYQWGGGAYCLVRFGSRIW